MGIVKVRKVIGKVVTRNKMVEICKIKRTKWKHRSFKSNYSLIILLVHDSTDSWQVKPHETLVMRGNKAIPKHVSFASSTNKQLKKINSTLFLLLKFSN